MPILKWKGGESAAVKELLPGDKNRILPLAEIIPVPWDWEEDAPDGELGPHLLKISKAIFNGWGTESEILVDLSLVLKDGLGPTLPPPTHPLTFLFDELRKLNVKAVPVAHGDEDAAFHAALKGVLGADRRGMALRIQEPLLFEENLPSLLTGLLGIYGLPPDAVDLVIDLLYIEPGRERALALLVQGVVATLPDLLDWRSLSLAASSFPKDFSGITDFSTSTYSRSEWNLWAMIRSGKVPYARTPAFADYAINHAEYEEVDPRAMIANGNIRYTTSTEWLYVKGTIVRDMKRMGVVIKRSPGFAQFVGLAQTLIAHPAYCGPSFSFGDQQIDDVANARVSTGNLMTWRKIGTNHHITFVVRQIASSSWPSSSTAPIP